MIQVLRRRPSLRRNDSFHCASIGKRPSIEPRRPRCPAAGCASGLRRGLDHASVQPRGTSAARSRNRARARRPASRDSRLRRFAFAAPFRERTKTDRAAETRCLGASMLSPRVRRASVLRHGDLGTGNALTPARAGRSCVRAPDAPAETPAEAVQAVSRPGGRSFSIRERHSSSDRTATPSSAARRAFDPASSPATT